MHTAYSFIHPNLFWTFTTGYGEVTARFKDVTTLGDGRELLSGVCVDEYGWWHRKVHLDLSNVQDLRRVSGSPYPEPAPFAVSVTFEWRPGLIRLTVPDDVARRLDKWRKDHWTEIVGCADGYSATAKRGTWAHRALAYLHSVQSHTTDDMPFVEGVSFASTGDEHGNGKDYSLLVTTCGIHANTSNPTVGFHFRG